MVAEVVRGWQCSDIFEGCSGNFTVQRALADQTRFRLHGNDVTLYTSALGSYLAGQRFPIAINPEMAEVVPWVEQGMGSQVGQTASVLLVSDITRALAKPDNPYYRRLLDGYIAQWPGLLAKTVGRLEANEFRLASYANEDVMTWITRLDHDQAFISYPPFFLGDYTAMYAMLDRVFVWEKPSYVELDRPGLLRLFAEMMSFRHWMFGSNLRWPELEDHLRGITQTTNRGVPIYAYSSDPRSRITMPNQDTRAVMQRRLYPGEEIGGTMTLHPLKGGEFRALRSQYMNRGIIPGEPTIALGVCVDGRLIGAYAISAASSLANWWGRVPAPWTYLLSDFPVAPTDYPRLAKLVLYAALSTESQRLIQNSQSRRVRGLITTAYSKRPVSMKYRGVLELVSRKHKPDAEGYYGQPYELGYGSALGRWTLAEGLAEWRRRHGQREVAA
jgi:hypothetical protein